MDGVDIKRDVNALGFGEAGEQRGAGDESARGASFGGFGFHFQTARPAYANQPF